MKLIRFLNALVCVAFATAGRAQVPTSVEFPAASQPQLTSGSDGRIWLVFGRVGEAPPAPPVHAEGQKHSGHQPPRRSGEVFVAQSRDNGIIFSQPVKVDRVPDLMLGMRRGPRISVQGDRVTVTLVAHELLAYTSIDGGKTWSAPATVNDVPTSAREGLHDLAGAPDGSLYVTWLDLRNGKMELWGASSRDGGRTWAKNEQVYKSPDISICECCHPSALFDAGGNLAVMWRNSIEGTRDMWISTRSKGANRFSPATKVGRGTWMLKACPMDGGRIVALGEGKFGAVWQRAGEVFLSLDGAAEVSIGQGKQPVAIKPANGEPLIVWQQGANLVSPRGRTGEERMNHATDARFPSLIALPNSKGFLLAYERGPAKGATSVTIERLNVD